MSDDRLRPAPRREDRAQDAGGIPRCDYFVADRCRSCALIETPYEEQLREKELRCRELLPDVPESAWLPSVHGGVRDFRNKAKLVVGGRPGRVTLGILGPDGAGVDLRDCLIQSPGIRRAIPHIAEILERTGLAPYDVPRRRGELKFVHITESPGSGADSAGSEGGAGGESGELMLRFVVRSDAALARLRRELPALGRALPMLAVVSVNLLPEHKAVLEGEREELLLGSSLTMDLGDGVPLHLRPQSFFQTNTGVARALYAQAAEWVSREDPASLWDLYCGVGGFALHIAAGAGDGAGGGAGGRSPRRLLGVEISEAAVRSARRSAREAGIDARFTAADATAFALASDPAERPEAVIVNPPRRGIGAELCAWLEGSGVGLVIYSSCNPESLARDLVALPSYAVREARVFDMFPHTRHLEVAVLLARRG
ncbi:methyltransferase domain-containing protein [Leucobacter triazinivorans]|uniref:23S rRNA (Uracil(747)-C(5))-methyltransferase n=1 Tax=Leucobacter triazinivorans TaxID=1784719 RepID=A0A4P6KCN5_9MICO|nr:methyltransferase domain-containing protein [Leucobacter triazinivorans]QBE47770.1 23S rRNA (uracil(747)-C(5))-methyltransferase [Leucobacter triazinivorans]